MRRLARLYDATIVASAVVAGALVAFIFAAIFIDVTVHAFGLQPPVWAASAVEYSMLYLTMLAAPWLVRKKAHIVIDIVRSQVSEAARRRLEHIVCATAIVACLILAYYGADLTIATYQRGDLDIRSVDMPRWLLYAPMPAGFLLIASEFVRLLFGADSLYRDTPTEGGGL